jgi:TolB-like protein/tetratricopeptide (TPR) repeat protein
MTPGVLPPPRPGLFAELRRRNVIRMAGLYLVSAWLLIQVAETVLPAFDVPGWVLRALIILLAIGFVPALVFSWIYELTPEGVKRDAEINPASSIAPRTTQRMDRLILVGLAAVILVVAADRVWVPAAPERADVSREAAEGAPRPGPATPAHRETEGGVFIAVLPFENYSPDPADAYFASGMTEEITSQLSRVSALRVVSRTAVTRALASLLSLSEIAETLGVGAVLEGSVRKSGNQVRITTQLVDAVSGRHLWSRDFDRELSDVFGIQRDVALAIVAALQAELSPGEQARIETPPTDNVVAYQLYLRSQEFSSVGIATNRTSIELLRQAVALDPDFSDAWARLSWRYTWAARLGDLSAVEEAFTTARRALELDPESPFAHFALGSAYSVSEEIEENIESFEQAVALDPDHFTLQDLSFNNAWSGRSATALAQVTRAVRLSRNVPNTRWHAGVVFESLGDEQRLEDWLDLAAADGLELSRLDLQRAWLLTMQGRSAEALELLRAGRLRWVGDEEFERESAALQLFLGDYHDVRSYIERQAEIAPEGRDFYGGTARSQFAQVLLEEGEAARAGTRLKESLRIHQEMFDAGRGFPERWLGAAAIQALQGRHEEALHWLQVAFDAGFYRPDLLARDRRFAALHGDPRFQEIIAHMADAQAAQRARVEAEGIAAELDAMIAAGLGRAAPAGSAEARQ